MVPIVNVLVEHDPWWLTLLFVLLPAVLAVGAAFYVQLKIAPSLETRRRTEARWEKYALELGELLTGEFTEAAASWAAASSITVDLLTKDQGQSGRLTPSRQLEVDVALQKYYDQGWGFARANTRILWLCDRLESINLDHPGVKRIKIAREAFTKAFEAAEGGVVGWSFVPGTAKMQAHPLVGVDVVRDLCKGAVNAADILLKTTMSVLDNEPPTALDRPKRPKHVDGGTDSNASG